MNLGAGMIGIFIPVYLFNLGYSVQDILLYYIYFWGSSMLFIGYSAGWFTAKFGPKHSMALGNLMLIVSLILLITLESVGWPLYIIAMATVAYADLSWIGSQTEISKLSNTGNSGKVFAKNWVSGKLAGAVSPLVGGLIATFIDVRYSFVVALFFVTAALVVIIGGEEPVVKSQKLRLKRIKPKTLFPTMYGIFSLTIDYMAGAILWPLFIAAFIITGNSAYASLGAIVTAGNFISIAVLMITARYADKHGGSKILKFGSISMSMIHFARIFANSVLSVFLINTSAINVSGANRIPIYKGMYALVDKLEGFRISFFTYIVIVMDITRVVSLIILYAALVWFSDKTVLQFAFALGSINVLFALKALHMKGIHAPVHQQK